MSRIKIITLACLLLAASMLLYSCDPLELGIAVGLVTNETSIRDRSFNAAAWKGIQNARRDFAIRCRYAAARDGDYLEKIQRFITRGCGLVITMGYMQADATRTAALADNQTNFVIVDYAYDQPLENVLGIIFQTDEAAFLAGYAAAAATTTGTVGAFGAQQIAPVTLFMDGFSLGVRYYNQQHGASVAVLGWNPDNQTGLFTGSFDSTENAQALAEEFITDGADIIMPVAGQASQGAAAAALGHSGVFIIGVDTDWTISAPAYADIVFTSVLKKIDVAVYDAIASAAGGTFKGGNYIGTLENNGVGVAKINWPDLTAGAAVEGELDDLKSKIISGAISTRAGE